MLTIRGWTVWSLSLMAVIAWVLLSSPFFQECIQQPQDYQPNNSLQGVATNFSIAFGTLGACVGRWIETNNNSINVIATVVIAAFTATLWITTHALWRVRTDAATAAKRTADAAYLDQRPWLTLRIEEITPLMHNSRGFHLAMRYEAENAGRTPAVDIKLSGEIRPLPQGADIAQVMKSVIAQESEPGSRSLGPSEKKRWPKVLRGNQHLFEDAKTEAVDCGALLVICRANYGAVFGGERFDTAKAFRLYKVSKNALAPSRINLGGENIPMGEFKVSLLIDGSIYT